MDRDQTVIQKRQYYYRLGRKWEKEKNYTAAEVFKEIGDKCLEVNSTERAILFFEQAIEKKPNIRVKKKLDELKNKL